MKKQTTKKTAVKKTTSKASSKKITIKAESVAVTTESNNPCAYFKISGKTKNSSGQAVEKQSVLIYKINIKGASVYKKVTSVGKVNRNEGFEFLTEKESDCDGYYSAKLSYPDDNDRQKLDVVVFSYEGDEITGYSDMVNSENYCHCEARNVDVIISRTVDTDTEFKILDDALTPYAAQNSIDLSTLYSSKDLMTFIAGELEQDYSKIKIYSQAYYLKNIMQSATPYEIYYGIGRQNIKLDGTVLYSKKKSELEAALEKSMEENIIAEQDITSYLDDIHARSVDYRLLYTSEDAPYSVDSILKNALPNDPAKRTTFLSKLREFDGSYEDFWSSGLNESFSDVEKSDLILSNQLTLLTGNHQPLVSALFKSGSSITDLLQKTSDEWKSLVTDTGVPADFTGDAGENISVYSSHLQNSLNAAFPTQKISLMLKNKELFDDDETTGNLVSTLMGSDTNFDIATSRIHDLKNPFNNDSDFNTAKSELMKVQRVFQVSTTPDTMKALIKKNLHSSHAIAGYSEKAFIKMYAKEFDTETNSFVMQSAAGSETVTETTISAEAEATASAIYQRASFISTRSEMAYRNFHDIVHLSASNFLSPLADIQKAAESLKSKIPNYTDLFGTPDICECYECESVYGAASYFVDLLQFLAKGTLNEDKTEAEFPDGKSPLDIFKKRRPDLLYLPLTCENTNTIIPYIDLVNEVMEFYVAYGNLEMGTASYDTGDATAEELRANPQNFKIDAYEKIKDAVYPFTLPYHQPLDAIRIYSSYLKKERYEVMQAMQKGATEETVNRAIASEILEMSEEEYVILTKEKFDPLVGIDSRSYYEFFGCTSAAEMELVAEVPEFLQVSGIAYTDLVELISTQFINPDQNTLTYLQSVLNGIALSWSEVYKRLKNIFLGLLNPFYDAEIKTALIKNNSDPNKTELQLAMEFEFWVRINFQKFQSVITLYEPNSECNLDTTSLRTIEKVYESDGTSGLSEIQWSRIHRFIRLWKKLGWSIHETDLMIIALGETDITPELISKLSSLILLNENLKLSIDKLAVLWGDIDTYGSSSLYKKLFLNKAFKNSYNEIFKKFEADQWGNYLTDSSELIGNYLSYIVAFFKLKDEEIQSIMIDSGVSSDSVLNIENLSSIYRYAVLSKSLGLSISDFILLKTLFGINPFSSPADCTSFYEIATAVKDADFNAETLQYIFKGIIAADSSVGLDPEKAWETVKTIRDAFNAIELDNPEESSVTLTSEIILAKLCLTFSSEAASQLMGIIDGTVIYETSTTGGIFDITVPDTLASKFTFTKDSGRMTFAGVISDSDKTTLDGLVSEPPYSADQVSAYLASVQLLYNMPDVILEENFSGIFPDIATAKVTLINHAGDKTTDEKLDYIYDSYIPVLKEKLREDAVVTNIALLISLSSDSTTVLLSQTATGKTILETLKEDLSETGVSATYYPTVDFTGVPVTQFDSEINFDDLKYPDPAVEIFSVKWEAYVLPPANGDYLFSVSVKETDETFKLYIDDAEVTDFSIAKSFNSSQFYKIKLEYSNPGGDAGVLLYWKTATSAFEIIPSTSLYPVSVMDKFPGDASLFLRCALFISGFELEDTEVERFVEYINNTEYKNNFEDIFEIYYDTDGETLLLNLSDNHWKRIYDYVNLRNTVPQTLATLTDIFDAAVSLSDPLTESFITLINSATSWDIEMIKSSILAFEFKAEEFLNEVPLKKMYEAITIASASGIQFSTLQDWGGVKTDFTELYNVSQLLKSSLKAKYEDQDWLDLSGEMNDKLREHQRDALISYLLVQQDLINWGITDADGLFEYFLIDVQMGSCMDTSRIVQANAAVQMFVNRCFLNLESKTDTGKETGVAPDALDKDRWGWMEYYRVWEANRKVFTYPENWLEPDWRNDKSEFFEDLESELIQNDITDRTVETAFRNYLSKLNDVANLDVCGMYEDEETGIIHVFGRSHNAPYKYYYRTKNEVEKWSAWETVQVDIKSVDNGDDSGVHLIPVMWKKRLILFWPEFMKKQESSEPVTISSSGSYVSSQLIPSEYWEIRLAWSEYVNGIWSTKQLTKEFMATAYDFGLETVSFRVNIDSDENLSIQLIRLFQKQPSTFDEYFQYDKFKLTDIQGKLVIEDVSESIDEDFHYDSKFMKLNGGNQHLELDNKLFLEKKRNHSILYSNQNKYSDVLSNPFFYSDAYRTYFVKPSENPYSRHLSSGTLGVYFTEEDSLQFSFTENVSGNSPLSFSRSAVEISTGTTVDLVTTERNIPSAFEGTAVSKIVMTETNLQFNTFYHPYSSKFVKKLNEDGMDGLMSSDISILWNKDESEKGETFINNYSPTDLVPEPSDYSDILKTYYKENICFDPLGANSKYNYELFFHAPLYIAIRLSRNGKYEEAMKWFHYIFDPTSDDAATSGEDEVSRFWKVLPFKYTSADDTITNFLNSLSASGAEENDYIKEWRDNPFDPHLIAEKFPISFMKYTVVQYVQNLIDWADAKFRLFTREYVYEALQLYVLANHILGPRPEFVPKRGEIKAESYASLEPLLDDFSNAHVEMENLFPYSSNVSVSSDTSAPSLMGTSSQLYFCIPSNDKLIEQWDVVADRLYKIRHCMNIDGVEMPLALFAPPIDPAALVQATSAGLSLGSILSDLSSPPPIYRFSYLIQKANEFCNEVKSLGSSLLSAFERKESEELSVLRATQETMMLELMTSIKERNVLEAQANREGLSKSRDSAVYRFEHYKALIADETEVPEEPSISKNDTSLPSDTSIEEIKINLDDTPTDSDEAGVKIIPKEKADLDKSMAAKWLTSSVGVAEGLAGIIRATPQAKAKAAPMGVGAEVEYGGVQLGDIISAGANVINSAGNFLSMEAAAASKMAGFIRREQDWILQANLAAKEIIQLDKQIIAADIRVQVAEKDLENHLKQIENSKEVEQFLSDKFTNTELYQWMKDQLYSVYKQSYNLAYDLAKKAEKAYKYEIGNETASFILYGYWDSTYQGLASGEKLQLALRQIEKSYMEENKRELELTKNISLASLNPLSLIELRETGKCYVSIPEELFDLDFQGHYFRRIKSVRLSIPCIAGPYTTINCTLRLLKNTIRIKTSSSDYVHNNDEGIWTDDDRFRENIVPVKAIATSTGQNDAGMFELNFRDERYLPFEGAGTISDWLIELGGADFGNYEDDIDPKMVRQFDYTTISDVLIQISYTAKEDSGTFRESVMEHITGEYLTDEEAPSLMKMFSLKNEFSSEWYKFLNSPKEDGLQELSITFGKNRFPYFARLRNINFKATEIFARCINDAAYKISGNLFTIEYTMIQSSDYGDLYKATSDVEGLNIEDAINIKITNNGSALTTNPDEIEDLYLVFHYSLG